MVRSGRRVYALPDELTRWVGTEAGKSKPVHIAMDQENLLADLKEGLAYVRRRGKGGQKYAGRGTEEGRRRRIVRSILESAPNR